MNATSSVTVTVTLTLNKEEARWLKDAMQNSVRGIESPEEESMRINLFQELKVALSPVDER